MLSVLFKDKEGHMSLNHMGEYTNLTQREQRHIIKNKSIAEPRWLGLPRNNYPFHGVRKQKRMTSRPYLADTIRREVILGKVTP